MIPILLAFQTLIWAMVGLVFVRSRRGSMFHPFTYYLAFHGIVFVIRPILERAFDYYHVFYSMMFYPTDEQFELALLLSTAALLVFALVCWKMDGSRIHFERPSTDGFTRIEWRAFLILALMLVPIGLYSAYLNHRADLIVDGGNMTIQMERDPETGIAVFTNTTGYLVDAEKVLGTLSLMLIWAMRFRPISFVPFGIYILERAWQGWSRWTIIMAFASLLLLYLYRHGRRWIPLRALVVVIPIFLVFHQLGANREYFQSLFNGQIPEGDPIERQLGWFERQDNPDFANLDFLTYVMDAVPDKTGTYSYFTQYLQLFTEPIPRILWPGKPFGPPIQLVNLNDFGNWVGWTTSIVGDGWISGGWLGVIVTMMILGYINSRLHSWFWRGRMTNFKLMTYCNFVPLTLQWYRDGGISIAKFTLIAVGPVLFWGLIQRALRRPAAANGGIGQAYPEGIGRPMSPPARRV